MRSVDDHWVVVEASRCLLCEDSPCSAACPAGVDVRGFIRALRFGDPSRALKVIMESNVLAGTCGILCRHEVLCEGACTQNALEDSIRIGRLQYYAAYKGTIYEEFPEPNKGPVAIVGGGPAGLAAAYELRRLGISVEVFEASDRLGGVLVDTLPPYRQPVELVRKEIERIARTAKVNYNIPFGKKVTLNELVKDFKAVLIAVGKMDSKRMEIPGSDLPGIFGALEFLREAHSNAVRLEGRRVVVIGGGSVAVDCAVTARRQGAQVSIVYRRSPDLMPATLKEKTELMEIGVSVIGNRLPVKYERADGGLKVLLGRVEWIPDGTPKPSKWELDTTSLWEEEVDIVVEAIGEVLAKEVLEALDGVEATPQGIRVDEEFRTTREGVFAAGDCVVSSDGTIVGAVAQGRDAAKSIARFLEER